jgi:hypothetical protein
MHYDHHQVRQYNKPDLESDSNDEQDQVCGTYVVLLSDNVYS